MKQIVEKLDNLQSDITYIKKHLYKEALGWCGQRFDWWWPGSLGGSRKGLEGSKDQEAL